MSAVVPFLSPDRRLSERVAAGDEAAWADIDARFRPRLRRYVATLARPGTIDPDDVVQDALLKAYGHLSSGRPPAERLQTWLYRITRNTAIDAIRASGRRAIDGPPQDEPADRRAEPERVALGRERLRGIVQDLAELPDQQRRAFLAGMVDGRPTDEVAAELGVTPDAARMTILRAREALMRTERARDALCTEVRPTLRDAHDRGVRPTETARQHLRSCAGCRAFRSDLRRLDRRLGALAPPGWMFGLLAALTPAGLTVKGVAITAGVAGAGASAVVAGTLVVGQLHVENAGSKAPFRMPGGHVYGPSNIRAGDRIPKRTTLVHTRVDVPASATRRSPRFVVTRCPAGQLVGGLAGPEEQSDVNSNPVPAIFDRRDTAVRWQVFRAGRSSRSVATLGVICRTPDAQGSILAHPRHTGRGERAAHVCDLGTTAQRHARGIPVENRLFARPSHHHDGRLMDGQPLSVLRSTDGGRWLYVIADDPLDRGWIDRRFVC